MNTKSKLAKNKVMKTSTKIFIVLFIIMLIPIFIFSKSIVEGIEATDKGFAVNFDVKGIVGLVLLGLDFIIGIILYARFLLSLEIDKMLLFSTLPIIVLYGFLMFSLAKLSYLDNDIAKSFRAIMNIVEGKENNAIWWGILLTIVFLAIIFFTFICVCRPIDKVENIVLRLGDGKLKEGTLNIGGGKQFNNIEHGLNKINSSYIENGSINKNYNSYSKKNFDKQFIKVLGNDNIEKLTKGENICKNVVLMKIKLFLKQNEFKSELDDEYNMLKYYKNFIIPYVKKSEGVVESYGNDGVVCIFDKSEIALKTANSLLKLLKSKINHNKNNNLRVSIVVVKDMIEFSLSEEYENKRPIIVSSILYDVDKIEQLSKRLSLEVVFTKRIVDEMPIKSKFHYRYIGSILINSNNLNLYQSYDFYDRKIFNLYDKTKKTFEDGVILYKADKLNESLKRFDYVVRKNYQDKLAYEYLNKVKEKMLY